MEAILGLVGDYQSYLALLGLVATGYFGLRITWSLWRGFRSFVLARVRPAVDFKKMGRWAAITGATDGIGKAYAEQLAAKGMDIILISRTQTKLEKVADEIESQYKVNTKVVVFDYSQGIDKYDVLTQELDGLDIGVLVNNVGYSFPMEFFLEVPNFEDEFQKTINMNIVSTTMMNKMLLPRMVEKGRGVVINVGSAAGFKPGYGLNLYSGAKAFIDFHTRGLDCEYRNKGVIIQAVMPYWVITSMVPPDWKHDLFHPKADDYVKYALATVGMDRRTHGYPWHQLEGYFVGMMSDHQYSEVLKPLFQKERKRQRENFAKLGRKW